MPSRHLRTSILLLLGLIFSIEGYTAGSVVLTQATSIFREPNGSAEILGRYPAGTRFKIESEEDGWYSVKFSRPFKGASIGWINSSDVDSRSGGFRGRSQGPSSGTREGKPFSYSLKGEFGTYGASTAELLSALGEPQATLAATYYGIEFAYYDSKGFMWGLGGGSYTFKQSLTMATGDVHANGYLGDARLGFRILQRWGLQAILGGYAGMTYLSMGSKTATNTAETAGIMTPYFGGRGQIRYRLGKSFGIDASAGYQMLNFNAVPKFQGTLTAINLSGIFWNLGLSYLW